MAEKFYTILTNIGLAKIANSQVTGNKVNLVEMAVGDSNGSYYNPTSNDVTLQNEKWRGPIGSVEIDEDNANWIVIETVIPSETGGFTLREVGLFDEEGNLIAIGKYPETYKPVLDEGSAKDLYIRMIIEVSNASAVTLKVDPTVIIASRKYVDEKIALAVSPISQSLTGLQELIEEYQRDFATHLAEKATNTTLGHVMVDGETITVNETGKITAVRQGLTETTATMYLWVDGVNGSDEEDGKTSLKAFKTIGKAISLIPDILSHSVTVFIADGTYDEGISISQKQGAGTLTISNQGTGAYVDFCVAHNCYVDIMVIRMKRKQTSLNMFQFRNCTHVYMTQYESVGGNGISFMYCRFAHVLDATITSSTNNGGAISVKGASNVILDAVKGTGNLIGIRCSELSTVHKVTGTTITGTNVQVLETGGQIR